MKVGDRVEHQVYGLGTVVNVEHGKKMGDGGWPKVYQSSIIRLTNGASRYEGTFNVAVKFDNGGPMGFAKDAVNNVDHLVNITDPHKTAIAETVRSYKNATSGIRAQSKKR